MSADFEVRLKNKWGLRGTREIDSETQPLDSGQRAQPPAPGGPGGAACACRPSRPCRMRSACSAQRRGERGRSLTHSPSLPPSSLSPLSQAPGQLLDVALRPASTFSLRCENLRDKAIAAQLVFFFSSEPMPNMHHPATRHTPPRGVTGLSVSGNS